ncbi:uncharacterized protein LOC122501430 [Leptopilina heterotoma]|uniref:uncharacterized protein LOC122501430 n=1 Tax=Leptopilina heterotoma TaxID=63436 RepID=UPI001CA99B03|nr:uncharacterized protein LOC122501430 [Leptopilina heterotoma]
MLSQNKVITKGNLSSLNPFLDDKNILRVGGRLNNSDFNENKKHPMLISASDKFAKLLFENEHRRLMHAGPQLLLYTIREQFWPLGGRNLAKNVTRKCITCFKVKPRITNPIMGDLPKARVSPSPPFYNTGVDYAGPFMIKDRKGRGAKSSKCYISVFVCLATKALHLELVSDLTSEAFIATLRRFVFRRGKPGHIYSDNGLSFVGARNELDQLGTFLARENENLRDVVHDMGFTWHFIPAYSPHFGGIWEAGVKSTKYHLKRVAGNQVLTFEEFYTLIVQIEGLLNSRPLTPLSSDPHDYSPLTPAHLLLGRPTVAVADPDLKHLPENRLSR